MSLEELIESRKTALTAAEVAELLHVSGRLVYQLVSKGEIPHFRIGGAVRFEPKALSVWLHGKMRAAGKEGEFYALRSCDPSYSYKEGMTDWWREILLPEGQSQVEETDERNGR